ncbi:MAG: hypothetical protein ACREDR_18150 [Blastocatellia bacterium]
MKTRFFFLALVLVVFLPGFDASRNGSAPIYPSYVALADDGGSHGGPSNSCPCPAQAAPSPQCRTLTSGNKQPMPTSTVATSRSDVMALGMAFLLWIRAL